jgi:hypothetical protein
MAAHADTIPAPTVRRRLGGGPASSRRRVPSNLAHLAHLAPILANRDRIEALAAALIDLLDSFDAPMADREDEPDCCAAADDDLAPNPSRQRRNDWGAGTPEDAEPNVDDEASRQPPVMGVAQ